MNPRLLPAALPWLLAGLPAAAQAPTTAAPAGTVLAAFPSAPDPALRYVVYLHGRIVEEQGRSAVSPEYGPGPLKEWVEYAIARIQTRRK